jgi:nucleoside phosphorylase
MDATRHDSSNHHGAEFAKDNYTVGWICALHVELAASQAMLDQMHPELPQDENDSNAYTLGRIGQHNVVLACLPSGTTGNNVAATAAKDLLRSFPKIRFGLMVGVGGGAPGDPNDDPDKDLHLGDVVVSNPEGIHGKKEFYLISKSSKFIRIHRWSSTV